MLQAIETQLKQLSLWQQDYPSAQALSSQQPFCCDTLKFEQWLQFILIPRMNVLIDGDHPLPGEIAITPMAQEAFNTLGIKANVLINTIDDFDKLLSCS
ncbi:MAG: YqcC family protein [Algicola sp.]|nr:YqcC family protein [Algicola sp.]